ncbi:hypothetical protein ABK905_12090 [Acerihabitans sp. KWT182]|uniref:Uncharacterized protein n=1 Tax=Acerihabitans sp. KWT182 TaxID=3157919 RepID=A0AAU7QEH2_9GAMM
MDYMVSMGFMVLMVFIPPADMLMESGKYVERLFNNIKAGGGNSPPLVVGEITL